MRETTEGETKGIYLCRYGREEKKREGQNMREDRKERRVEKEKRETYKENRGLLRGQRGDMREERRKNREDTYTAERKEERGEKRHNN